MTYEEWTTWLAEQGDFSRTHRDAIVRQARRVIEAQREELLGLRAELTETRRVHELVDVVRPAEGVPRRVQKLLTILLAVERDFGVSQAEMQSQIRTRRVAQARQVYCWLARVMTDQCLEEIGKSIGNRDHSTVLHAVNAVDREGLAKSPGERWRRAKRLQALLAADAAPPSKLRRSLEHAA